MNINWSEKPEGFPIWIEDLHPEEFADGSGWHRDDGDRYTDQDGMHWGKPAEGYYRVHVAPSGEPMSAKSVLENMTDQDRKIIALEATIAQQAQMIEHLRGGPTPGYTAVDMTTAAAQGFRDGVASKEKIIDALLNHCDDGECYTCGQIICPHGEPLHFHHDGCPACAQDEAE